LCPLAGNNSADKLADRRRRIGVAGAVAAGQEQHLRFIAYSTPIPMRQQGSTAADDDDVAGSKLVGRDRAHVNLVAEPEEGSHTVTGHRQERFLASP
jgi:hypothetical protein